MTNRELHDLGIDRSDIHRVAQRGFSPLSPGNRCSSQTVVYRLLPIGGRFYCYGARRAKAAAVLILGPQQNHCLPNGGHQIALWQTPFIAHCNMGFSLPDINFEHGDPAGPCEDIEEKQ